MTEQERERALNAVEEYGQAKIKWLSSAPIGCAKYADIIEKIFSIIEKTRGGYLTIREAAKAIEEVY